MLLAAVLGAALACPATTPGQQLITVEAASTRSTYAQLTTWKRAGNCWVRADGPFLARVGMNGLSADRHEGDGTTPIGTFTISPRMYGNAPNPGVRYRYRRLRCGDWWSEDPTSPTYNSFQHVQCGRKPSFRVEAAPRMVIRARPG